MRTFWAFLMLVILSLPIALKIVWIADWIINNEIAQANCINKENEETHCNGSCQLDQKMAQIEVAKSDINTESNYSLKLTISEFILYTQNTFSYIFNYKDVLDFNIFIIFYKFQYSKIHFKPPLV
jgi:hypothetical protein